PPGRRAAEPTWSVVAEDIWALLLTRVNAVSIVSNVHLVNGVHGSYSRTHSVPPNRAGPSEEHRCWTDSHTSCTPPAGGSSSPPCCSWASASPGVPASSTGSSAAA